MFYDSFIMGVGIWFWRTNAWEFEWMSKYIGFNVQFSKRSFILKSFERSRFQWKLKQKSIPKWFHVNYGVQKEHLPNDFMLNWFFALFPISVLHQLNIFIIKTFQYCTVIKFSSIILKHSNVCLRNAYSMNIPFIIAMTELFSVW